MLAEPTADDEPDIQAIWNLLHAGREFRAGEAEALADLLGHSRPQAASWKERLLSSQSLAATYQAILGTTSSDMYAAYRSISLTNGGSQLQTFN